MQCWLGAERAKNNINRYPDNIALKETVINLATASGFFSIWMTVFVDDSDMRLRLIKAFAGTEASGCFDQHGQPIASRNPDQLVSGGKL